ncbi:hypothetical protein BKA82DRAFT_36034 [Pisolithus tinctorius]|uniref:Uncharacterized protein n=1 Tax=Pisolithus tinctorius Marx 270 TaxID=870435 RepID=A0A0C3NCE5_PISTI|nr:hypothetical protein BKA82DRAFT_36034 [Pisolithus tinctorius]KIN93500.1 hypothetical protein M404DRAFT_36034 [Pisolithus tinctorius Marx 270]
MEVTMEVEQVMQDTVKAKPVKLKLKPKGMQGRPTNISDLPHVVNIEVEAHHVTADDCVVLHTQGVVDMVTADSA